MAAETPDIDRDRKQLWGFAIGDRIKVVNEVHGEDYKGLFGHVSGLFGNCAAIEGFGGPEFERYCRSRCGNIEITDLQGQTHRISSTLLIHVD